MIFLLIKKYLIESTKPPRSWLGFLSICMRSHYVELMTSGQHQTWAAKVALSHSFSKFPVEINLTISRRDWSHVQLCHLQSWTRTRILYILVKLNNKWQIIGAFSLFTSFQGLGLDVRGWKKFQNRLVPKAGLVSPITNCYLEDQF